jgi:hypothetical protein
MTITGVHKREETNEFWVTGYSGAGIFCRYIKPNQYGKFKKLLEKSTTTKQRNNKNNQ